MVAKNSSNFRSGKFQNQSLTPMLAKGYSWWRILHKQFRQPKSTIPPVSLPSIRTELASLDAETPVIVWFGHSSYLICSKGKYVLVDPVFSGSASPIPGTVKAFPGTDIYKTEDMPPIDLMIITHNHYDHLDRKTLLKLTPAVKVFCTGLGVGKDIIKCTDNRQLDIREMDWWDRMTFDDNIVLTATPARHFSGRGFVRGRSLWSSFVLEIDGYKIFIGGDSGYDRHFKAIGESFGPFDIALLECGQYNEAWPHIHMMPEETAQAAIDLQAQVLMPVHWGKFRLANHPWNEPVMRLLDASKAKKVKLTTPLIGEPVWIDKKYPNTLWWQL
ncbi:MBL fold metallo-hydrolase [Olivibacter sp. SDN3]|uniref:MBL fold metallo-hydrolase n=1 Tax=Olivibacter sp. SDN3 TaxID=2764720 RepID=UPI0016517525|nr:MBL fold metallo-hydrolase [Olivibacter sp. SDN3]QNL50187.1 MBL fold metallo-hydrolase [Olivibacter sp. SDN3]